MVVGVRFDATVGTMFIDGGAMAFGATEVGGCAAAVFEGVIGLKKPKVFPLSVAPFALNFKEIIIYMYIS